MSGFQDAGSLRTSHVPLLIIKRLLTRNINITGIIVNRTYVVHKNLPGIYLPIFTHNIWSYLLWTPVIVGRGGAREHDGVTDGESCVLLLLLYNANNSQRPVFCTRRHPAQPVSVCVFFTLTLLEPRSRFGDKLLEI